MEQNNNKRMQLKNSRKGSLDWNAETFAGIHPQNILKKMLLSRLTIRQASAVNTVLSYPKCEKFLKNTRNLIFDIHMSVYVRNSIHILTFKNSTYYP
jgi:hypothetical protein